MSITPVAPSGYERYAALYGPTAVSVEEHLGVKSPQRSTEAANPVSAKFSRRQAPPMQNKVDELGSTSGGSRGASQGRVIVTDQELTDLSWLAEYASKLGDVGGGLNSPSARKVAEIYGAQRNVSPQILKRSG